LRRGIRELPKRHVRWGRRFVYRRLRIEGCSVNHKQVKRIWREGGFSTPSRTGANDHILQEANGNCYVLNTPITSERSTSSSIRPWMGEPSSSSM
jgi:hypothetical protein